METPFVLGKTPFFDNPTIQTSSCVLHTQPKLKNVTIDFVFVTRSMQSVILCSCCCFSAHRSHFACFSRARGDDVFVINFGC